MRAPDLPSALDVDDGQCEISVVTSVAKTDEAKGM